MSKRTRAITLLIITLCLAQVGFVQADGCAVRRPQNHPSWEYAEEENQVCYIEHSGGVESMLLSIDTSVGEEELIWIFPVPSDPESVNINITTDFPTLKGVNVGDTSKKVIHLAVANARNKVFIPYPEDFQIVLKYGVQTRNILNTSAGTYTKDMILDPPVTINLTLTQRELDTVWRLIQENEFYTIEEQGWQRASARVPMREYSLSVHAEGYPDRELTMSLLGFDIE